MDTVAIALLSGLAASLLTIIFQIWAQRIRLKADLAIEVSAWIDEMLRTVNHYIVSAETTATKDGLDLRQEYRDFLRNRCPPYNLLTRISLTYGKDCRSGPILITLAGEARTLVTNLLKDAKDELIAEGVEKANKHVREKITPNVGPLLEEIVERAGLPKLILKL